MIKTILIGCLMFASLSGSDCQQSEIDSKQDCEINRLKQAVAKLIKERDAHIEPIKAYSNNLGKEQVIIQFDQATDIMYSRAPIQEQSEQVANIMNLKTPIQEQSMVRANSKISDLKNIELNTTKRCNTLSNIEKSYIKYDSPKIFKTKTRLQIFEFPAIKANKIGSIEKDIKITGTHYTRGGWVKCDSGWVKGYVLTPSIYNTTSENDVKLYNSTNSCKGEK